MEKQQAPPSLDVRYVATAGVVHMTGIHALARLPLDVRRADIAEGRATAVFISGYEGSPLGGYDLELGRHASLLVEHDITFRPGLNEELAATAVQGSQLAATMEDKRVDGVTGFWYGKSPGLDRASDALRHANLGGTHVSGGAVALVGDDPTAKSSTMPGASEMLLADLGMPILYPADPQEVLDFGMHAVSMSRVSGLWTSLKIVTNVADGSGTVDVDPARLTVVQPDRTFNGVEHVHEVTAKFLGPSLLAMEGSRNGPRLELARRYARANGLNRVAGAVHEARIGLVAAGKTYVDMIQGLKLLGLDETALETSGIRLLKLGMIYPVDAETIRDFAAGLSEIVVVEEKRSFVESAIKDVLFGDLGVPKITGKTAPDGSELFASHGELSPDMIAAALSARLIEHGEFATVRAWRNRPAKRSRTLLPLAVRTPYFCSGCPHNSSVRVPEGSMVGGGIGCHGLALVMSPSIVGEIGGLTQMGGEGAQWIGMSPFVRRGHLFQNIGDGTFHHSGSLAVRASVAGGANITYKLLYNSAVAMTGGQQAVGQMTVAEVCRAMLAEGVSRIIVTTDDLHPYRRIKLPKGVRVWSRDRLMEAQEELAKISGVTMLIHDQECATELRRKRKRGVVKDPVERIMINERVCEGCGDCGVKSNCLSVQPVTTEFGRKTKIDQSSCNKDYSCLQGDCPSFLSVVPNGRKPRKSVPNRPKTPSLSDRSLPDPVGPDLAALGQHTTRVLGIGGSGVVTLSQILSVAATRAGLHVVSLDQTGLAQKGGAVVSDIKLSHRAFDVANKAAAGEVDLYIGSDLLVAADPSQLAATDPFRTVAVVSTDVVPTGHMVADVTRSFPAVADLVAIVRESTLTGQDVFLDARTLSTTLFGEDQFANMLLIGAGYQLGSLPLPADSIEEAIRINGVKAEQNIQAFRRGRQLVHDPAGFADVTESHVGEDAQKSISSRSRQLLDAVLTPPESELHGVLSVRVPDLIAYQSARYARRYVEFVEKVRRAEESRVPGSTAVATTVARHLHKLMAYKDEYEVARLSLDPQAEADAIAQFGPGARISYRLHPPLLRALGMKNKISLGPWFKVVFRALRAARHLRGTPLDVFGWARVRRVERELVEEYIDAIDEAMVSLSLDSVVMVERLASLPDMVRGYEHIKMQNAAAYRAQLESLRGGLAKSDADVGQPR